MYVCVYVCVRLYLNICVYYIYAYVCIYLCRYVTQIKEIKAMNLREKEHVSSEGLEGEKKRGKNSVNIS